MKINWGIFFLILLAPVVATTFAGLSIRKPLQDETVPVMIALLGGGASGIACGIMLGLRLAKTLSTRIALCLLFGASMPVVSITLCFFGCLGGNALR